MHVDRKPSPWPCVAMLAALLLLCLAAPRYWWTDKPGMDGAITPAEPCPLPESDAAALPFRGDARLPFVAPLSSPTAIEIDLAQRLARPSIEELIALGAGLPCREVGRSDWPVFTRVVAGPVCTEQPAGPATPAPAAVPGPLLTAAFEQAGRTIVEHLPADAFSRASVQIAKLYHHWSLQRVVAEAPNTAEMPVADATSAAASTLRLIGPDDRLAMVIREVEAESARTQLPTEPPHDSPAAESVVHPWCVPHALLKQLDRLARHPSSTRWAERTLDQVHVLTRCNRPEGDDIEAAFAALSNLATDAMSMAEETSDERLRVELLRAYWALARRLDAWAVVHDICRTDASRERLAMRGTLGSFFGNQQHEPVEVAAVLKLAHSLETYERLRTPQFARLVVRGQRALQASPEPLDQALAAAVEQHYRNANVRIAITAAMLNRLIGDERSETRPLHDRIAGTPVRGRSQIRSESRVRLNPGEGSWRLTLQADGVVDANTLADGGQARLRSHSATDFDARKLIVIDPDGVQLQRTLVDVSNYNRLLGVTTDYDWVPLLGSYARTQAIRQYRARRAQAKAEVESKVSAQTVAQIDRQTMDAVQRIERQLREQVTGRLAGSGVDLTPIELRTTPERVVTRIRVAGAHQLGSHTPRPRALSDSLASVQLHETALTNAAASLELDGRSCTAAELQALVREKFPRMSLEAVADSRETVFHFAPHDAVQFYIGEGRLELALALTSIELDGRTARNFIVHAYYVPVVHGLEAELVRDGTLGIEGRLSSGERARLHNVFNRVLPPDRQLPILRLEDANDPRLEGLMITQLVLEDGWLGLAVGPMFEERVAERDRSLR